MIDSAVATFLRGTVDEDGCKVSKLRGCGIALQAIIDDVESWHDGHIQKDEHAMHYVPVAPWMDSALGLPPSQTREEVSINMMPIHLFDMTTVPDLLARYVPLIQRCAQLVPRWPFDRIAYLTVHESWVQKGETQRRPGLHIERPGVAHGCGGRLCLQDRAGPPGTRRTEYQSLAWGLGCWMGDIPIDGIYMASNVANTCRVWPAVVEPGEDAYTDVHGGLEHARDALCRRAGPGVLLGADQVVWITDRTPHESLAHEGDAPVFRQFFRLVVGPISVWYARHNTPNPLGVQPEAPVSDVDKFKKTDDAVLPL